MLVEKYHTKQRMSLKL